MSELLTNWSIEQAGMGGAITPPEVITTQRLMEVCAQLDTRGYTAAVLGLIGMLVMFVWMGRIRPRWAATTGLARWVPFIDKMLMVFVAMQFVTIIVSMLRAG